MVRILAEGDNRHRLENSNGTLLGLINGRAIRFIGFASEQESVSSALTLWRVMDDAFAREFVGWKRHEIRRDNIMLVHDGAYHWVSDGLKPIARLLRGAARGRAGAFAIEFVCPSFAKEGTVITVAQVMARTYDALLMSRAGAP